MRLNIYLDDPEVRKQFRIAAIEEGTSASRLAQKLIRQYLEERKASGKGKRG